MSEINNLNPAEEERLSILLEEMGESLQIIGKIQRHGYESADPTKDVRVTNRELLEMELGHVRNAMIMLCDARDLSKDLINAHTDHKAATIGKWLHYN